MDLFESAQRLCELEKARCVFTLGEGCTLKAEIWMNEGWNRTRLISDGIKAIEGVRRFSPPFLEGEGLVVCKVNEI